METKTDKTRLLKCKEVAKIMDLETEKIRILIRSGQIPAIDLLNGKGGRPNYRIKEEDILLYLKKQANRPYIKPTQKKE